MNLTQLIDIKERIAISDTLTLLQRKFVLDCINQACGLNASERDPNDYPRDHKPGKHWATDKGWEVMNMIPPGAISPMQRDLMSGIIAGMLVEARKVGAREGAGTPVQIVGDA